jgi:hypothetical protein
VKEYPIYQGREILIDAFHAIVNERNYYVGFGIWSEEGPTQACGAVIERVTAYVAPDDKLFIYLIYGRKATAYRRLMRLLQSFPLKLLIVGFQNADILDEAMCPLLENDIIRGVWKG